MSFILVSGNESKNITKNSLIKSIAPSINNLPKGLDDSLLGNLEKYSLLETNTMAENAEYINAYNDYVNILNAKKTNLETSISITKETKANWNYLYHLLSLIKLDELNRDLKKCLMQQAYSYSSDDLNVDDFSSKDFFERLSSSFSFKNISSYELSNFLNNFITKENSDIFYSLLSFKKEYLLAVIFLLKENLITLDELEEIIELNFDKTREELLLKYLSKVSLDILFGFFNNGVGNLTNNPNEINTKKELNSFKEKLENISVPAQKGFISNELITSLKETNNKSIFSKLLFSETERVYNNTTENSFQYSSLNVIDNENFISLSSNEKAIALFIKNFIKEKYISLSSIPELNFSKKERESLFEIISILLDQTLFSIISSLFENRSQKYKISKAEIDDAFKNAIEKVFNKKTLNDSYIKQLKNMNSEISDLIDSFFPSDSISENSYLGEYFLNKNNKKTSIAWNSFDKKDTKGLLKNDFLLEDSYFSKIGACALVKNYGTCFRGREVSEIIFQNIKNTKFNYAGYPEEYITQIDEKIREILSKKETSFNTDYKIFIPFYKEVLRSYFLFLLYGNKVYKDKTASQTYPNLEKKYFLCKSSGGVNNEPIKETEEKYITIDESKNSNFLVQTYYKKPVFNQFDDAGEWFRFITGWATGDRRYRRNKIGGFYLADPPSFFDIFKFNWTEFFWKDRKIIDLPKRTFFSYTNDTIFEDKKNYFVFRNKEFWLLLKNTDYLVGESIKDETYEIMPEEDFNFEEFYTKYTFLYKSEDPIFFSGKNYYDKNGRLYTSYTPGDVLPATSIFYNDAQGFAKVDIKTVTDVTGIYNLSQDNEYYKFYEIPVIDPSENSIYTEILIKRESDGNFERERTITNEPISPETDFFNNENKYYVAKKITAVNTSGEFYLFNQEEKYYRKIESSPIIGEEYYQILEFNDFLPTERKNKFLFYRKNGNAYSVYNYYDEIDSDNIYVKYIIYEIRTGNEKEYYEKDDTWNYKKVGTVNTKLVDSIKYLQKICYIPALKINNFFHSEDMLVSNNFNFKIFEEYESNSFVPHVSKNYYDKVYKPLFFLRHTFLEIPKVLNIIFSSEEYKELCLAYKLKL